MNKVTCFISLGGIKYETPNGQDSRFLNRKKKIQVNSRQKESIYLY